MQVCFADSPIAGIVITIGIGLGRWECAVGCLLGPFIALITCFVSILISHIVTQVQNLIACLLELLFVNNQEPYYLLQALGQSRKMIYNGMFLYNACLLGTVIPTFYEPLYGGTNDYSMWIMLGLISAMRSAYDRRSEY